LLEADQRGADRPVEPGAFAGAVRAERHRPVLAVDVHQLADAALTVDRDLPVRDVGGDRGELALLRALLRQAVAAEPDRRDEEGDDDEAHLPTGLPRDPQARRGRRKTARAPRRIRLQRCVGDRIARAEGGRPAPSLAAQAAPENRVVEKPFERRSERDHVAGRDEQAADPVLDELGDAADGAGDYGSPVRHRLEHAEGQALPV
jgi:hypothetical protein